MILIVVESLTGNTYGYVERAMELSKDEIKVLTPRQVLKMEANDFLPLLEEAEKVMVGAYTWDNGKIPKKAKEFVIEYRKELMEKEEVLIFGSGWTVYETYCKAVDSINFILENKFPTVKFELAYEKDREDCKEADRTLQKFLGREDV